VLLDIGYPDTFTQLLGLNVIQMLWDRGETNGYAQHLTAHSYPRTPRHTMLLLGAVGDHQVSEFSPPGRSAARWAPRATCRTSDRVASSAASTASASRRSRAIRGSARRTSLGHGSPLLAARERAAARGHDPQDDTPKIAAVQALKDQFWHPNGAITDVCAGAPARGHSSKHAVKTKTAAADRASAAAVVFPRS
jgi:hypothetical protein